ncbi:lipopolysaccharide biosynthesis protein [Aestuariivirga litoralis]|uniref:lipopolysaccharide biosynthesis protein n=1 Tax=Aestuariivirga litoralis TaxID=2650924 RepID=UPI0018C6A4FB|nr:oligosaccharide flippase family protein [Aestuariivirga litoralis]
MSRLWSLLTGSAGLFVMRLGGAGLGFITQILLAHMLGSEELGLFYSATSLAAVAGFVTSQGYSQIAYRFSARYRDDHHEHLFRAFVSRATYDGLICSTVAAAIVVAISFLYPGLDQMTRLIYAMAGATIIPAAVLVLYTNLSGAMRKFGWCYVPDGLARPLALLVFVVGLRLALGAISAVTVMFIFSAIVIVTAIAVVMALRPYLPKFEWPQHSGRRLARRWRAEALPLVMLSLYTNTFADVSILFAWPFLSASNLAVFGVCLKLSLLIGYFVQTAQQMVIPDIADARERRDIPAMRRAAKRSVVLPVLATSSAAIICAILGREILSFFGAEFAGATSVLVIMVASQVVRALAGPSAHVLTLSGAQKINAMLCVGALIVLAAANAVLGPRLGPEGAAWAVFISYTGWIAATAVAITRLGEMRTDLIALVLTHKFRKSSHPMPAE